MTQHIIQTVHDALAEASNSDELYALIWEHYQDSQIFSRCSKERDVCARQIGELVIEAIKAYDDDNAETEDAA